MTRNEDGTVKFEFAGDTFLLKPGKLPRAKESDGKDCTFTGFLALLGVREGRGLLAEAIFTLDGCPMCGKQPNTIFGVCRSHLING